MLGCYWLSNKEFIRNICIQYINQQKLPVVHSLNAWLSKLNNVPINILTNYADNPLTKTFIKFADLGNNQDR